MAKFTMYLIRRNVVYRLYETHEDAIRDIREIRYFCDSEWERLVGITLPEGTIDPIAITIDIKLAKKLTKKRTKKEI